MAFQKKGIKKKRADADGSKKFLDPQFLKEPLDKKGYEGFNLILDHFEAFVSMSSIKTGTEAREIHVSVGHS